jgi:hypothetical protein
MKTKDEPMCMKSWLEQLESMEKIMYQEEEMSVEVWRNGLLLESISGWRHELA